MANAEQDTGQNKKTENKTEWDSLATPFDTSKIENPTQDDLSYEAWLKSNAMVEEETDSSDIDGENPDKPFDTRDIEKPTQDDLSYEAWLRSNANPDQLDADGNPTGAVTPDKPFDTRDIENPTQDDLSYEAWLKSNANPDFPTDRDGNPNQHYEGPAVEGATEDVAESEGGREYDPTKSRWSQMSDEEKDALIHKYPRQEGENTNDWGKRIEASEGHRIFGVETEAVKNDAAAETATENTEESKEEAAKDNVEQTAKNGTADTAEQTTGGDAAETTKQTAEGTADKTTSKEAASDSVAPAEKTAPAETSNETTSESPEGNATEGEAVAQAEESAQETVEESSSTKEAPTVETEANQEDAEKIKEGLLAQLSGGEMAKWVESEKKLTRGQMKEMSIDALRGLIDEYNGGNGGPDGGLGNVPEGEDLGDGDKGEGSMAGQAAEMPSAAGILDGSDHALGDEARSVDANEAGTVIEAAENGVESFENETEKLNSRMDSILKYQDQSGVWEAMRTLLDKCSEGVKATVEYARQERLVARSKDMIAQYRRELKSLPLFTLPWSEARQRKNDLRAVIKTSLESLEYNEDSLQKLESSLPESLSDEEKGQVDAFSRMDMRMDRINADLHVRGNLSDIRMRESWISDQEKSIANNAGGINAPSVEKRRAFIAKTRADISNFQAAINNYQEAHPDFVLYPADGFKNPSYEDIMNSYDNSPDVVTDEEDEDIEDLDGAA